MQPGSNKKDLIKISRGQHHTNIHIVNPKVSRIYKLAGLAGSAGLVTCGACILGLNVCSSCRDLRRAQLVLRRVRLRSRQQQPAAAAAVVAGTGRHG